jgi:hypothetical protein
MIIVVEHAPAPSDAMSLIQIIKKLSVKENMYFLYLHILSYILDKIVTLYKTKLILLPSVFFFLLPNRYLNIARKNL